MRHILIGFFLIFIILQPLYAASNLVPNGSFELGAWGWSPSFWLEKSIDDRENFAFHGQRCLHLHGIFKHEGKWNYNRIQSQYFPITKGGEYTLSFFARSNVRGAVLNVGLISAYLEKDSDAPYKIQSNIKLETFWKRYSLSGDVKLLGRGLYLVELGIPGKDEHVWIDGVMLSEGQKAEYKSPEIEGAVQVNKGGLFKIGEKIELNTEIFIDDELQGLITISYNLKDYYGNSVRKWKSELAKPKNSRILYDMQEYVADEYGVFRLEVVALKENTIERADFENTFSVLPEFGNNKKSISSPFGNHLSLSEPTAELASRLGIKWVRLHDMEYFSNWFAAEPEKGVFKWFDEKVAIAEKHGLRILGVIEKPPYWASSKTVSKNEPLHGYMNYPPRDYREFGDYVFQMVSHYKGRIKYWEIWNEPYIEGFWKGTKVEFVRLMKTAYDAAKMADPSCVIVGPAGRYEYIKDLFELGAYRYIDILSYHQYFANTKPWNSFDSEIDMVRKLKELMRKHGVDKPVWNTEGGLISRSFYQAFEVAETPWLRSFTASEIYDYKRPSELIVKWYVLNLAQGVDKCFYYYMREDGIGYFDRRESYQSLLEFDRKPKAHGVSMAILAHMLGDEFQFKEVVIKAISGSEAVFYLFDTSKGPLAVAWREGSKNHRLEIRSRAALEATNIMGVKVGRNEPGPWQLSISSEPAYIRPAQKIPIADFISLIKSARIERRVAN